MRASSDVGASEAGVITSLLIRHSLRYLAGRGGAGLLAFVTLVALSRFLPPEEYGRFALISAAAALVNAWGFQWLRSGVVRYLPSERLGPQRVTAGVVAGFVPVAAALVAGGAAAALVFDGPAVGLLVAWTVAIGVAQGLFTIVLEFSRARLDPARYGVLFVAKAGVFLGVGVGLAAMGMGAAGVLAGLLAGYLLPAAFILAPRARELPRTRPDRAALGTMLRYGAPITVTVSLGLVVALSDRFFLEWLRTTEEVGVYALSYDLADRVLTLVFMVIGLAATPLAIRAFESGGEAGFRAQLGRNMELFLLVSVPASIGLAVLAPGIARVVVGAGYGAGAEVLLPVLALGAFLQGWKTYVLDSVFFVLERTALQLTVATGVVTLNLGLNAVLVAQMGAMGAAIATLVTYAVSLSVTMAITSALVGWRPPLAVLLHALVAAGIMAVAVHRIDVQGWGTLALAIAFGAAVYAAVIAIIPTAGRQALIRSWRGSGQ